MNEGKMKLLEQRKKRKILSLADEVQINIRNEGAHVDIRELLGSCPPNSKGWSQR